MAHNLNPLILWSCSQNGFAVLAHVLRHRVGMQLGLSSFLLVLGSGWPFRISLSS